MFLSRPTSLDSSMRAGPARGSAWHFTLVQGLGALTLLLILAATALADEPILTEDFEDGVIDPRISIETVGTFNSSPGIQEIPNFGSARAFGYGRSTCPASCFDSFVTNLRITFVERTFVSSIAFKEMELHGNWGSKGKIYLDGVAYSWGHYNENEDFGRQPTNDGQADTIYRFRTYLINRSVTVIELTVHDITRSSEIFIDDVLITGAGFKGHPMPDCSVLLLEEDFESCSVGSWIGNCNGWQTWANGDNPQAFYITDQEHVSGAQALHVTGAGPCWEGAAYRHFTAGRRVLLQAMMKASGSGPDGCHHYQNGFDVYPALWSFDMPYGGYPGGLRCSVAGGGDFVAVEGFANAAGRWYAVTTELDYDTGQAYFWLDGAPLWSTPFDTTIVVNRVWLRSGEGVGWFDDVRVCDVAPVTDVGDRPRAEVPRLVVLHPSVPNPVRTTTLIRFDLARETQVELQILDVTGRRVRSLLQGTRQAGRHEVSWDSRDAAGHRVPVGVYFCEVVAGDERASGRMVIVR